jgi:hypothetical protein
MLGYEDIYEPDEILKDVDTEGEIEDEPDKEFSEMTFENGFEAVEGYSLLRSEVESPEDLFIFG